MVHVQHYDLLGSCPRIEGFDIEQGLAQYREAAKTGQHGLQFTLGTKLTAAAAHFFGLSADDFDDLSELFSAMEAMNEELKVR